MLRRVAIVAVLVLVGSTLTAQGAWAKVFVGHTNLTIHATKSSVSGKLVGKPQCRPGQTIELFVDGASQGTTTTDGSGNYSFTGSFTAGSSVYTFFGGSQTGQHPNRFVCTPAVSRVVKRVVKIEEHGNGEGGEDDEHHNDNGDDDHGNHNGNGDDDDAARTSALARVLIAL